MNTINASTPGLLAPAPDLGRAPRRVASAAGPVETPAAATRRIETENRAAALGSIDDLPGAEAALLQIRLSLAGQPAEARAAQGSPSAEKALRLLTS
jgi:hypothetical protein